MKYGSTGYFKEKISTCEIAGAVALCAIRDLKVNLFRFGGFPQIVVEKNDSDFKITISITDEKVVSESFVLKRGEAIKAAKMFQSTTAEYDEAIFDRVQNALAKVVG